MAERRPRHSRLWIFRGLAILFGCLLSFVLLEGFLRLYEPFQFRIHGARLALPVNTTTIVRNVRIKKADEQILVTRNSIGFRGPDPPRDFQEYLTVIAVGGSTTECSVLSDERTWPARLAVRLKKTFPKLWLNNAGLDGHSTYGHLHLQRQYLARLRPDVILYLVGVNDVGNNTPNDFDGRLSRGTPDDGLTKRVYLMLVTNTATFSMLDNLRRSYAARRAVLLHTDVDNDQLLNDARDPPVHSSEEVTKMLDKHRARYLVNYRLRLKMLVDSAKSHGSLPVLITQPALYGFGIDPATKVDFAKIRVGKLNGALRWQILQLYNDVTREVAAAEAVPLIDLAIMVPKDSRYYYDYLHFTNAGAELVAGLLAEHLEPVLRDFATPDGQKD